MDSAIESYLLQLKPQSLLECSTAPWSELERFCCTHAIPFSTTSPAAIAACSQPFDLALVHDVLEGMDAPAGHQVLGLLRNSLARRIWLLVDPDSNWPLSTLIALGFHKADPASIIAKESYIYDLSSYNHKRSWNNPRFWANPENFNKFRW